MVDARDGRAGSGGIVVVVVGHGRLGTAVGLRRAGAEASPLSVLLLMVPSSLRRHQRLFVMVVIRRLIRSRGEILKHLMAAKNSREPLPQPTEQPPAVLGIFETTLEVDTELGFLFRHNTKTLISCERRMQRIYAYSLARLNYLYIRGRR